MRQLRQAAELRKVDAEDARRLREEEAAPYIVVDLAPGPTSRKLLQLNIENTGRTAARNVRLKFDPPLQQAAPTSGYEIGNWSAVRDGIRTMAPGRRIGTFFDNSVDLYHSQAPRLYRVQIDCQDIHGRQQPTLEYDIDLTHLFGAPYVEPLAMHDLVKSCRKIEETLARCRAEGLAVRTYPGE